MIDITIGVPTCNRYDYLSHTLLSIALQTYPIKEVIIVDDSDKPIDLRELPIYQYIFRLFDDKGIKWRVLFGARKGQHYSHQLVQEVATTEWIFRVDDDCILEPDVLEKLSLLITEEVGAIAPLVLMPNPATAPLGLKNIITDLNTSNIQWFKGVKTQEAEHLYSSFLYRKGVAKYDLTLSRKAFREETIFTHSIYRAGYKLIVCGEAVVHHFMSSVGGIRSDNKIEDYNHDEGVFQSYLALWGVKDETKFICLDNGIGDHWAFKNILPELKEKYKKIRIACCYPDVFFDDEGVELLSIAEAKLLFGNIDAFNIYKNMIDWNWKGHIIDAYKKLYL